MSSLFSFDNTYGVDAEGAIQTFSLTFAWIFAANQNLITLHVPQGVTRVTCFRNHFTELDLPISVRTIECDKELFDYDTCQILEVNIFYE